MRNQRTVQGTAEVRGVGLHTGAATTLRVGPAPADAGVVFVRTDLPGRPRIPVDGLHVVDRGRRTALAEGTAEVHTVEHLLSACHGLGVDDLVVEIDGVEVPGMDGSALPFVELLRRAGIVEIPDAPRRELSLADAVGVVEPGSEAPLAALPRESGLQVSYTLDYGPAAPFPPQHVTVAVSEDSYVREIAPARTFVNQIIKIDSTDFEGDIIIDPALERRKLKAPEIRGNFILLPTNQLYGNIIVQALEPKSHIGLATYKPFESLVTAGTAYPVLRLIR